ncbi:ATP-dependent DNA helicase RecG [Melissococcus plutonius]|uniref:ATP-dependent DNA helicase RecG n=1 Tax=Melissococcus plutonius (strain ATCC 35311 / DSM 29964 / CIP 104052 / LMG 20360 / NCIMB 702443) TaxID=940190 RepID=F3Y8C6_MELPT|nr:ATP-dependent DNA helicase RecG [Melissococcus plutonius]AIM24471.1 ATP-dependent DNA helicase RecG [Melissococcus plutonius S1]KMT25883.1 ATP-dependent DNA helicase RecG [Melissococcus plutonius]KMT27228.1 ATP-dependent DNA helicase RecG [Melissococcus plutonius]KMT28329.1 ATP-dependent DNA helicase RecG [Melissococcus plutonius]KMT30065.1 ATP-dependent DNA helicase RecG [Melissococcus plutonius]
MDLSDVITKIPKIGSKRAENLQALGIYTVEDLLTYYPFRYEDIQEKELDEIQDQEKVTLKGFVVSEPIVTHYGYKKNRLVFRIMQEHAVINVSFFNQSFLKEKVHLSEEIAIYGKWDAKRKSLNGIKILASKDGKTEDFSPIYHVNKKIHQSTLVQLIQTAFDLYGEAIEETLPNYLLKKYHLLSRKEAMFSMHFPNLPSENYQAKRRIVFEEFLIFQLQIQGLKKQEKAEQNGISIHYDIKRLKQFTKSLPFQLTEAQKKVTNEICRDLLSANHMQRLLQGDVGSGKTIVAAIVLYAVVTAGFQGALMVPTEILAQQHMESFQKLYNPLEVRIALLTSSTKLKERREILEQLRNGAIDIIIGTHALIQEDVVFHQLGLVITDEQHRFGVNQRKILREKGMRPDVLFMTATPIPRTLAITAFGEMDVSSIDEMPAGRQPVETRWVRSTKLDSVLEWAKRELVNNHQTYVICPLIEESEALDAKNALEIYEYLSNFFNDEYKVGLLHGKMKNTQKEEIMQEFKNNQLQILVSTTVIEVGVNVPNATLMLIIDADRFGLAQLHQLRGRVGRGTEAAYCILIADPKNELGTERMKIMTETTNGFELSEKDLTLRGSGEVFGDRQSGVPQFIVGDIVNDFNILEIAQQEAAQIWHQKSWWCSVEFKNLASKVNVVGRDDQFFD